MKKKHFLLVVFMVCLSIWFSVNCFAATKLVEIKDRDRTYTSYDFNGDGKNDKFMVSTSGAGYGELNVYLNGKKNTIFIARGCILHYYRYSQKNEFLIVTSHLYGGNEIHVYKFSGNTIKQVQELKSDMFASPLVAKATGKELVIELRPYHQNQISALKYYELPSGDVTSFYRRYQLDTKNHKFVVASAFCKPTATYRMYYYGGNVVSSSSSVKDDGKGLTLQNGKRYTLKQIRLVKENNVEKIRMQFKDSSGKTGWVTNGANLRFYYDKQQ